MNKKNKNKYNTIAKALIISFAIIENNKMIKYLKTFKIKKLQI